MVDQLAVAAAADADFVYLPSAETVASGDPAGNITQCSTVADEQGQSVCIGLLPGVPETPGVEIYVVTARIA
jgi:hypothetical protein